MLVQLWSLEDKYVHNNDNNNVLSIQRRLLITMSANNEPPVKRTKQLSVLHFFNLNPQRRSVSTTRKNQVEGECLSSATDKRTTASSATDERTTASSATDELTTATANTKISCPPNDIGLAVGKVLLAEEKSKFLQPWQPQQEHEYPSSARNDRSGQKRVLRKKHLEQFPWLAVNQLSKGAFCLPCVLFGVSGVGGRSDGHGQPSGALVTRPLQQFKKLTGKDSILSKHEKLNYHKEAVVMKDNFHKTAIEARHDDILSQLNKAHQEEVLRNRSFLHSIADTVLMSARQNIALRGHRNEIGCVSVNGVEPEENDGNFRALLRYRIIGGDNQLASFVKNAKQNATYHSAEIQNDLIRTAASLIKDEVTSRARAASFWLIIADETTDRQKRELLAILIRYAYVKEGKWVCVEDPVAVMDIIQRATAQDVQGESRLSGSVIGSIFLKYC